MKTKTRRPHFFLLPSSLFLLSAALALPCAALPLGLRLAARAAAAQAQAETPEERAYRIYAPNSAFEVTVTNGTTFAFSTIQKLSGRASFTIDWGDGTASTYADTWSAPSHAYAADGKFVVKISDDVNYFAIDGWNGDIRSRAFVTAALRWGDSVESTGSFGGFAHCRNMTGFVPRWPPNTKDASYAYYANTGVSGTIPPWNDKITNANGTYQNSGVTGTIPPWGPAIAIAKDTYYACKSLTGEIPPWTDAITTAQCCYWNCTGLTGPFPAWGANIAHTGGTYQNCGLTGPVPAWNDKITNADFCYYGCRGLTGDIPEWGAAMTSVSYCYADDKLLTGAWTDDPALLMPTNITAHGNCVIWASDALRALFYSDWGGSREKPATE